MLKKMAYAHTFTKYPYGQRFLLQLEKQEIEITLPNIMQQTSKKTKENAKFPCYLVKRADINRNE